MENAFKLIVKIVLFFTIIGITVYGLMSPPPGEIHSSLLVADGILCSVYTIFGISNISKFTLTFGNFTLKIGE